jgi:hypothetical protein
MLVIRVELWPYGLEEAKELLAEATVGNLGPDQEGFRYKAELRERENPALGISGGSQIVEIGGHDRRQSVWNLLRTVLTAARAQVDGQGSSTHALPEEA